MLGEEEVLGDEARLLYVYPQHHTVSFTLVAKKHIEYIRRQGLAAVQELDELTFPSFRPQLRYTAVLHPFIFIWERVVSHYREAASEHLKDRALEHIEAFRDRYEQVVGLDVCDSDQVSEYAVGLLSYADKLVVPSGYCAAVYRQSGVMRPVYRVPHGVDYPWYLTPNIWETPRARALSQTLLDLYLFKVKRKRRVLLFWLWHSDERKGWPEARALYERLAGERNDVVLVLKTATPNSPAFQQVARLGAVQVYGWLSDLEKMALYDLADITLVFTRGGGFEMNALESLARGVPVITSDRGSWTEYVPPFLQVRAGERVKVLEGNNIHVGYGYKVDVEDALNKVHDILENYSDYRARVEEWRRTLMNEYRWDIIAKRLVTVINS